MTPPRSRRPFYRVLRMVARNTASAALLGSLLACVSPLKRAEQLFADGALVEAAAAYEAALSDADITQHDRARFHLALIHGLPESPLHDPGRARQLLTELARQEPPNPYQTAAAGLLELDGLRATVAELESASKRSRATSRQLRDRLGKARDELERCERKLAELKRIDLDG